MKWLFLVHQVQTPNSRERVKVWRLTKKVGALLYRNSVYVLPYSKEHLEDFQWLCQQVRDSQGEASFFVAEASSTEEDLTLRSHFLKTKEAEYRLLAETAEHLLERIRGTRKGKRLTDRAKKIFTAEIAVLEDSMTTAERTDFFEAKQGKSARGIISQLRKELAGSSTPLFIPLRKRYDRSAYRGKTWATREHIHIDRLCSAWLILRFIDPKAKFVFAPESELPVHAIHFDTFNGEFSHRGEDCTFETLLKCFRMKNRALDTLAEIIHDIDIKDKKFNRVEAAGLDAVVRSLSQHLNNDAKVLATGFIMLDALYQKFSTKNKRKK